MPETKGIQLTGFVVAVVIAIILCLYFATGGDTVNELQAAIKLQDKINPNDAPAASLARLPGIGIIKANAIVEYRQRFQNENRGSPAFENCSDLDGVKGIGPITTSKMCEWLRFK